jgi:hypothetical protein
MVERILRGVGKLRKEGKYLCNTQFEITAQESRESGRPNLTGYLIGFDPKSMLGLAGETVILRLSDGGEQVILLLEDIYQRPRCRFRLTFPINPKFDPRRT